MMIESRPSDLRDDIKSALEQVFDEVRVRAYTQGWADAMAAVKKATEASPPQSELKAKVHITVSREAKAPYLQEAADSNRPERILAALRAKPGSTIAEILIAAEGGNRKHLASVRTTLHRLKKKVKSVMNREGKWYTIEDYNKAKEMELF